MDGIYNEVKKRIVEDVDLIYKKRKEKKRKGKKTNLGWRKYMKT